MCKNLMKYIVFNPKMLYNVNIYPIIDKDR